MILEPGLNILVPPQPQLRPELGIYHALRLDCACGDLD